MPAPRLVSEVQERLLLEMMQENPDIADSRSNSVGGPDAKQRVRKFWESVASRLNAISSGTTKMPLKWRDYWTERKYGVRKKAATLRARSTDTGTAKILELTEVEKEIIQLMSNGSRLSPSPSLTSTSTSTTASTPASSRQQQSDNRQIGNQPVTSSSTSLAPAWAIDIENRRLEAENQRLEVLNKIADTMSRHTAAAEATVELLHVLIEELRHRR